MLPLLLLLLLLLMQALLALMLLPKAFPPMLRKLNMLAVLMLVLLLILLLLPLLLLPLRAASAADVDVCGQIPTSAICCCSCRPSCCTCC